MRLAFRAAGPAVLPHEPAAPPRYHEPRAAGLPVVRWGLLTALLLAEVVGLTVAFDAGVRTADAGWAGTIIFRSPYLLRAGVVAALVIGVLGLWRLHDEIRLAAPARAGRAAAVGALAQLGAFALFVLAPGRVLGESTRPAAVGPLDLGTWLATGAMTVGLWVAAMVPPAGWPRLLRRGRSILLAGVLVAL